MLPEEYGKQFQQAVDNASEQMYILIMKENEFMFIELRDIFYELFEEIFSIVLKGLRAGGYKVSSSLVDFEKLVWDEDPDKLNDRISQYIDQVEHFNIRSNPYYYIPKEKFNTNFRLLDRLLINEAKHMKEAIIYEKLKDNYPYCEVVGGCDKCPGTGIIKTSSLKQVPPFHPDCGCSVSYFTEEEYKNRI